MAQMNISNTLVNDTIDQLIAYARQLKDDKIDWAQWKKVAEEYKTEDGKRQSKLNELFLKLHQDYHTFIEDAGPVDGVIDSWKEVEDFLDTISDKSTLKELMIPLYANQGLLTIELNPLVPGQLVGTYTDDDLALEDSSRLDQVTGQLILDFGFEPDYPTSYSVASE